MKSTLKMFFFAVCVTLFSCEGDGVVNVGNTSVSTTGILAGSIQNYVTGTMDSIKLDPTNMSGYCKVASDGKFAVQLTSTKTFKIGTVSGLSVSDTSAVMSWTTTLYAYKNKIEIGELSKCNYTLSSNHYNVGMSYSLYWYSDKVVKIKGAHTYEDSSFIATTNYDIELKQGWNELVIKNNLFNVVGKDTTMEGSISNVVPSELKWNYFKHNSGTPKMPRTFSIKSSAMDNSKIPMLGRRSFI